MKTNNYLTYIKDILAGNTINTDISLSVGNGTSTQSRSDTDMDNELYRTVTDTEYNNTTFKMSDFIAGFTSSVSGESISEVGFFDTITSGTLLDRSTNFTPVTISSTGKYFFKSFSDIDLDNNTSRVVITDGCVDNIYLNMLGSVSDYPTYVAFSTHLILDTFNTTTGWSITGGALLDSTNRKEGTGSVSASKTSTGLSYIDLTKTLSSPVDYSDVETFRMWVRINESTTLAGLTATGAMEFRIGSSSGDYKSVSVDRADLNTIWTLLEIDIGDFSTTGSPTMTGIDFLGIKVNSTLTGTTWTGNDVLFDIMSGTWPLSNADTTLHEEVIRKAITTITTDGPNVKYNATISTGEGNTYNYYFIGLFDDVSAGDMFFVNQLYLTSKSTSNQINAFSEIGVRFE